MRTETVIKLLLVICVIALCIVAFSKRDLKVIQVDPISQRIEAVKGAFPYEDTASRNRRAELIERILNEK
jgi:hypothetical protein